MLRKEPDTREWTQNFYGGCHHNHGDDRWMAAMTITTSFQARDVESAEELAIPAMYAVMEKALGDLREMATAIL